MDNQIQDTAFAGKKIDHATIAEWLKADLNKLTSMLYMINQEPEVFDSLTDALLEVYRKKYPHLLKEQEVENG